MFAGTALLIAFATTLITETLGVVFVRTSSYVRSATQVVCINCITHPLIIGYGFHVGGMPLLIAEIIIIGIEAIWYYRVMFNSLRSAVLFSCSTNGASFAMGFVVAWLLTGVLQM